MPFDQPQSIRTVFFDAGFTLLRPHPSTPEICRQVCRRLDLHIDLEAVEQRMFEAEDYYLQQMRSNRHTWDSEETILQFWMGYYANLLRPFVAEHDEQRLFLLAQSVAEEFDKHTSWETYPDVLPVLEALKAKNYALGVISDWGIALGPILSKLNLTQYFDCLLVSAVTHYAKPAPQLYDLALQRANAIADYTVHIGDSYIFDVLGARSVGITPILLDRRRNIQENSVDCLLIHSLTELLELLEVAS